MTADWIQYFGAFHFMKYQISDQFTDMDLSNTRYKIQDTIHTVIENDDSELSPESVITYSSINYTQLDKEMCCFGFDMSMCPSFRVVSPDTFLQPII